MFHKTVILIIGNTNVKCFAYIDGDTKLIKKIISDKQNIEKDVFFRKNKFKFAIIVSVVPVLTSLFKRILNAETFIIENDDVPIENLYVKRDQTGIDRLLAAFAAKEKYGSPLLVIDFGTATTFNAVDGKGSFIGGMIVPGMGVFQEYLSKRTAKLPLLHYEPAKSVIGRNTRENIQNGTYFGSKLMIEGIIGLLKARLGHRKTKVVATGGYAKLIAKHISGIDCVDEELVVKGAVIAALRRFRIQ